MTAGIDSERQATNARILLRLLDRSQHLLLRQAHRHAQRPDDAEEALQSACALFVERYNERCQPLAWLYTTIKREAWRMARCAHRRRELPLELRRDDGTTLDLAEHLCDANALSPDELAVLRFELAELRGALTQLKPDERDALLLLASGHSYREIAAARGWTLTKVNRCIAEGRAALRSGQCAE